MTRLAEVLAEHHWAAEVAPPEGVDPYLWCVCGWRSDDATSAHWASGDHARLAHAHVAAAVTAWLAEQLASDGLMEAVEEDLRNTGHHPPSPYAEVAFMDVRHARDAALAAVVGALAGES